MLERTSSTTPSLASRPAKPPASCVPHLGLRKKMTELCQAIGRAWCECTGQHELRFGLSKAEIDEAHTTLDMLMNLSKDEQRFQWGESKVTIHLQEDPSKPGDDIVPWQSPVRPRRHSSNFTGTTLMASPENSPRRDSPIASTAFTDPFRVSTAGSSTSKPMQQTAPQDAAHVEVMCKVVEHGHRRRRASSITFYDDKLWHHSVTSATGVVHNHPGIGLTEYLQEGKRRRWTMQDRKLLQVLLARSVLFFPWKGYDLGKHAIAFHHDPPQKPFASLEVGRGQEFAVVGSEDEKTDAAFLPYRNETLAALATVLLEIELQKAIEDLVIDKDVAALDFETRFWATTRVLEEKQFDMNQGCFESIEACLRCDFTDGPTDLDDTQFLEQVYERIVAPLEAELWHGFRMRAQGMDTAAPPIPQLAARLHLPTVDPPVIVRRPLPGRSVQIAEEPVLVTAPATTPTKTVRMAVELEIPGPPTTAGATPPQPSSLTT